eukprot:gene14579-19579_t
MERARLPVHDSDGSVDSNDEDSELKKLGYDQVLHRGLSSFSNFAFGFTEVAVLASLSSLYGYGLATGGPAAIFWGFLITFILNMCVAYSMAEICAAYPSAGSVYHWSAQLVPKDIAPLASYICGWFNFLGNAAGDASFAVTFAQVLNAGVQLSYDTPFSDYATVGISIITIFVWSFLNMLRIDNVGWINSLAAICHSGGILIIIIVILAVPKSLNTGEFVFTSYYNDTGFSSQSYVIAIGLLTGLFAFSGFEASAHMAEETHDAATTAPKGIIYTVFATGIGGIFYVMCLLFSTTDISAALNGPTKNAAANVFYLSCGRTWGQILTWIVVINLFFAGISSVAVTGRITFALARDNAFPYSSNIASVHKTLKSPINAIMMVCVVDAFIQLLPLIPKNGSTAFTSIVGLCTIGFQVSYGIPILLKLLYPSRPFPVTPMALGIYSKPIGIISCLWMFGTSFLFILPTQYPLEPSTFNWLILVLAIVFIFCYFNWIYNSKFTFKGPKQVDENDVLKSHLKYQT